MSDAGSGGQAGQGASGRAAVAGGGGQVGEGGSGSEGGGGGAAVAGEGASGGAAPAGEVGLCELREQIAMQCGWMTEADYVEQCRIKVGELPSRIDPRFFTPFQACAQQGCDTDSCLLSALAQFDPSVVDPGVAATCMQTGDCERAVHGVLAECLDRFAQCDAFDDLCLDAVTLRQDYRQMLPASSFTPKATRSPCAWSTTRRPSPSRPRLHRRAHRADPRWCARPLEPTPDPRPREAARRLRRRRSRGARAPLCGKCLPAAHACRNRTTPVAKYFRRERGHPPQFVRCQKEKSLRCQFGVYLGLA